MPASDEALKTKLIPAAEKALGAQITLETINANDIQPRVTAAISSGSGPDIFNMLHNWQQLYAGSLVDVWHQKENYEVWFLSQKGFSVGPTTDWEKHKLWEEDPVTLPYRTGARAFRLFGWEGPPSAKATEVQTKYIITDMYAKAVQGTAPEGAVKWAEGQLREIYGKA